ncbi:F-box protein At3g28330-like [Brassica rapa]|uniref:F-box protein At3g28330-like n=1 Tax=Brassica campestris TaxID=3711 RepID=UPI00142DC143|nr:F-box protein At3g28330-like [Brassica rapa]
MDHQEVVLSMDTYATSIDSVRCRVTPFPDLEKTTKFTRACTTCQGFLMYMNIVDGSKLCSWRLQSEGWQLISEISPGSILTRFDYVPMTINPFDAKTAYFWSTERESLLSINLHNGKFVIHRQCEGRDESSDGPIMIPVNDSKAMISLKSRIESTYIIIKRKRFVPFVLPQWLHRIPNTVSVTEPTTTATLHG